MLLFWNPFLQIYWVFYPKSHMLIHGVSVCLVWVWLSVPYLCSTTIARMFDTILKRTLYIFFNNGICFKLICFWKRV